jgi:hypothetical protein
MWQETIVLVQPQTILKWHRSGYRLFWRYRSKSRNCPHLSTDTIDLIRDMAKRGAVRSCRRGRGDTGDQDCGVCSQHKCRRRKFVGSARREMLDHVIVLDDRHLGRINGKYKRYFDEARQYQRLAYAKVQNVMVRCWAVTPAWNGMSPMGGPGSLTTMGLQGAGGEDSPRALLPQHATVPLVRTPHAK